jgi:hypothetical protein
LLKWKLHRDNVAINVLRHGCAGLFKIPRNVTKMTLKSAFEDLSRTTLGAISGCLRKLEYLAGLRQAESYSHWGLGKVYGEGPAKKALTAAHREVVSEVLSTPLRELEEDAVRSSDNAGMGIEEYLGALSRKRKDLLPGNPGAGSARHLNSVLRALVGLERARVRNATRRAS